MTWHHAHRIIPYDNYDVNSYLGNNPKQTPLPNIRERHPKLYFRAQLVPLSHTLTRVSKTHEILQGPNFRMF